MRVKTNSSHISSWSGFVLTVLILAFVFSATPALGREVATESDPRKQESPEPPTDPNQAIDANTASIKAKSAAYRWMRQTYPNISGYHQQTTTQSVSLVENQWVTSVQGRTTTFTNQKVSYSYQAIQVVFSLTGELIYVGTPQTTGSGGNGSISPSADG